jgi:hypothetical protein
MFSSLLPLLLLLLLLQMRAELEEVLAKADALQVEGEGALEEYRVTRTALWEASGRLQALLLRPQVVIQQLKPGRLVQITEAQVRGVSLVVVECCLCSRGVLEWQVM